MKEWGTHRPRWAARACIWALGHPDIGHGLKRHLRNFWKHVSPYCDIEIDGIRLRCYIGDNVTETGAVIHGGRQNANEVTLITGDLRAGDVFIDVGANCGFFTLFAARKVSDHGRIIAIEPIPQMLDRLIFNIRANGFKNVAVFKTAVGAKAGAATLYVRKRQHGQSSMLPIKGKKGYTPMSVLVTPLHSIFEDAGIDHIDAMKIDIEGYEDRALIPMIENAPRSLWPRRILMEVAHRDRWEADCVQRLVDAGYRIESSGAKDVLLVIGMRQ